MTLVEDNTDAISDWFSRGMARVTCGTHVSFRPIVY